MSEETGGEAVPPDGRGRTGAGRRLAAMVGLPLLLVIAGYVGLYVWQGDRIPSGTTVAGVDVGDLSTEQARDKVAKHARSLGAEPVTIRLGEEGNAEVVPSRAGLALDVDATMKQVSGETKNPIILVGRIFGGSDFDGVMEYDRATLADAVHKAASSKLTSAAKDGSVSIEGGRLDVVRSTSGQGVDAEEVAGDIVEVWPAQTRVTATIAERKPRLGNAEIDRFVKEFATPAVSGALNVAAGEETAELSPEQIGELVTITQKGGRLSATVDGEKAADTLRADNPDLEQPARDAKVKVTGKKVATVAGRNGTKLNEKKLGAVLLKGLTADQRQVQLPTTVDKPDLTRADLKGIDTTSVITEYRSKFPGGASNKIRTQNMRVALKAINGTVVPAGEQFSLIQTLGGDLTPEKGYGAAPTIQDGKERAAQGGGVSQVSTAMYNAAFFAGVRLDEHKPHSFWIERYPAGREATIWVPQIDNKWTNDTGKPIVVLGKIEGDEVVVTFLGQRKYEVETSSSEKYNIRRPKTVEDDHPGCLPVPTNIGFDIDVTRTLKQGGTVVRTEKETTSYKAANRVVCTHPSAR